MLGATLRVKFRMADLCRANRSVSTLELDINGWFIDGMFIGVALGESHPARGAMSYRGHGRSRI
jgi:hypothetical protein